MAIAYKSAGTGATTEASGGDLNPTCPATVDAGDILIAHVGYEGTATTPSTPADWTLLTAGGYAIETSSAKHWIFGKIAVGDEDGDAISFGTPAVTTMRTGRIYSFSGRTSGTITQCVPTASFAHQSHATDPAFPSVTTTIAGALAVACIFQIDDNGLVSATGESGGDWTEAVAEYTQSATTPDSQLGLQTCTPTANPGTVTGGTISTANDPVGVIGFQILGNTASTVALGTPADNADITDTTPDLIFTGTDADTGDTIEYDLELSLEPIFDAVSSNVTVDGSGTTLTWSHTTSTNANSRGIIVVGVGLRNAKSVTGITYGGDNLTKIRHDATPTDARTELWYKLKPKSGANDVVVTINAANDIIAGAQTWENVGSIGDNDGTFVSTDTQANSSVTLTSASNEAIVDVIILQYPQTGLTSGQTNRWNKTKSGHAISAGSSKTGSSSVSMTWTWSGNKAFSTSAASLMPFDGGSLISSLSTDALGDFEAGHPWDSAEEVTYTVQSALTASASPGTTYYWRVRGKDSGTGTWGAWSPGDSTLGYDHFHLLTADTGRSASASSPSTLSDAITLNRTPLLPSTVSTSTPTDSPLVIVKPSPIVVSTTTITDIPTAETVTVVTERNVNASSTSTLNDSIISKGGNAVASTLSTTTLSDAITSKSGNALANTASASTLTDSITSRASDAIANTSSASTLLDAITSKAGNAVASVSSTSTLADAITTTSNLNPSVVSVSTLADAIISVGGNAQANVQSATTPTDVPTIDKQDVLREITTSSTSTLSDAITSKGGNALASASSASTLTDAITIKSNLNPSVYSVSTLTDAILSIGGSAQASAISTTTVSDAILSVGGAGRASVSSVTTIQDIPTVTTSGDNYISVSSTSTLNDSLISVGGGGKASTSSTTTLNDQVIASTSGDNFISTNSTSTLADVPTIEPYQSELSINTQSVSTPAESITSKGGDCLIRLVNTSPQTLTGASVTTDTYMDLGTPTATPDSSDPLSLCTGNMFGDPYKYRGLIKFDLSGLPAGSTITNATLYLYARGNYGGASGTLNVYRSRRAWVESQASWNNWSTGNAWTTAGAADTTNDREADSIGSVTTAYPTIEGTENTISLTASKIQEMYEGTFTNNGFVLKTTAEAGRDGNIYWSSEYTTEAKRPKLVVQYSNPANTSSTVSDTITIQETVEASNLNITTNSTSTLSDAITSQAGSGIASVSSISTLSDSVASKASNALASVQSVSTLADSITAKAGDATASVQSVSTVSDQITSKAGAGQALVTSTSTLSDQVLVNASGDNYTLVASTSTLSDSVTAVGGAGQASVNDTSTITDIPTLTTAINLLEINTSDTSTLSDNLISVGGAGQASTVSTSTLTDVIASVASGAIASVTSTSTLSDSITSKAGAGVAVVSDTTTLSDNVSADTFGPWYYPDSLTVTTGAITSGDIYSTWGDDDNILVLAETTGTPGFDYIFNFKNVISTASKLHISGNYIGNSAHDIKIYLWNYLLSQWDAVTSNTDDLPSIATEQVYDFNLLTPTSTYISGGEMMIRVDHVSPGNINHTLNLDTFELSVDHDLVITDTTTVSDVVATEKAGAVNIEIVDSFGEKETIYMDDSGRLGYKAHRWFHLRL